MTHENVRYWQPEAGWSVHTKRHAAHQCGWTCVHPAEDPGGFRAKIAAHNASCPWPDEPELVETVSD